MENKLPFNFMSPREAAKLYPNAFVVRIPGNVIDRNELFRILDKDLNLPDYFGRNWDALHECLRDLTWLPQHEVVLVHEDLPRGIGRDQLRVYLEIISDAVTFWQDRKEHEHSLVVAFPTLSEFEVRSLLRD